MTGRRRSVGMSPCPNDTFMFHALIHEDDCCEGVQFEPVMDDIEGLNARALDADRALPYTKMSCCAFGHALPHYRALRAGAALGRGCGPLVVVRDSSQARQLTDLRSASIAIPGAMTTAWLLTRLYGRASLAPRVLRYDEIMRSVATGSVDAGLIIHESRFTYKAHGLRAVADLGDQWEADTGLPLPLGVIAAKRSLDEEEVRSTQAALAASVRRAWAHPERSERWVSEHAQELDRAVCQAHIDLYVNHYSEDLGEEGMRAVEQLLKRGRDVGALPPCAASPWS